MIPTEPPTHPRQVTPAWLTEVLRQAGTLTQSRIRSVRATRFGEEIASIGQLVRFELAYYSPEAGAPPSVVGKFSRLENSIFPAGEVAEVEARFYTELAAHPSLAAPRCYYSAVCRAQGVSVQILEDLGQLRHVDIVAGCGQEDVERVVEQLAIMHSHWWASPRLRAMSWLPDTTSYARLPFRYWWQRYPAAVEELLGDAELSPNLLTAGQRLAEDPRGFRALAEPPLTCLHRDIHAENLCFGVADGDPPIVLFDWELVAKGRGPSDLTYFLVSSVPVARRRRMERDLLAGYHAVLTASGVVGYSLEQCWRDYRLGVLGKLLVTVHTTVMFDNTDPQRRTWRRKDLRRLQAFLADHPVADLL